jgi:endonuclease/exonuclease/phosphatase (EEP) superfamily protein YafD
VIVIAIPAVALAVFSLATYAGRWVWWLDVAANFRIQYIVGLLILSLLVLVSKWRKTGYFVLAVALVNLIVVLPIYAGGRAEATPGVPTIRVMTFNLLSTNESYAEVVDYLGRLNPDLVFLHEVSRPWEVAIESADLGYELIRARSDDLIFGSFVLVRGESLTAISHGFGTSSRRAVELHYVPPGWPEPISVLGIHPLAPTDEERAALRDAQLGFATEWAGDRTGAFLVAGDFNATPWSWPFRRLIGETDLRNSQIGFGLQPSFSAETNLLLRVPIDHLLHSPALEVINRSLGPFLGSDHFPLVVDLQLVR